MKPQLFFLSIFILILSNQSSAQNLQGVATYKTDRQVDLKNDDNKMSDEIRESIAAQLKKQFQREFTLSFNDQESVYEQVEEGLGAPSPKGSGGITITLSGNTDLLYRNVKDSTFVNQTEIMGKQFLIKDAVAGLDWKFEKETKKIGEYICFKATLTEEITTSTFDSTTEEFMDGKKERVTTAWYTLDIPLQHGPGIFWGLPGLVLEINDGQQTILCSKIVLNPNDGVAVEKPSKGKEVDQEEFNRIQKKKNDEMMEQYQGAKSKKSGNVIMQRIGG